MDITFGDELTVIFVSEWVGIFRPDLLGWFTPPLTTLCARIRTNDSRGTIDERHDQLLVRVWRVVHNDHCPAIQNTHSVEQWYRLECVSPHLMNFQVHRDEKQIYFAVHLNMTGTVYSDLEWWFRHTSIERDVKQECSSMGPLNFNWVIFSQNFLR